MIKRSNLRRNNSFHKRTEKASKWSETDKIEIPWDRCGKCFCRVCFLFFPFVLFCFVWRFFFFFVFVCLSVCLLFNDLRCKKSFLRLEDNPLSPFLIKPTTFLSYPLATVHNKFVWSISKLTSNSWLVTVSLEANKRPWRSYPIKAAKVQISIFVDISAWKAWYRRQGPFLSFIT